MQPLTPRKKFQMYTRHLKKEPLQAEWHFARVLAALHLEDVAPLQGALADMFVIYGSADLNLKLAALQLVATQTKKEVGLLFKKYAAEEILDISNPLANQWCVIAKPILDIETYTRPLQSTDTVNHVDNQVTPPKKDFTKSIAKSLTPKSPPPTPSIPSTPTPQLQDNILLPELQIELTPEEVFIPDLHFEEEIPQAVVMSIQDAHAMIDALPKQTVIDPSKHPEWISAMLLICNQHDMLRQGLFLKHCMLNKDHNTFTHVFHELKERHVTLTPAWTMLNVKLSAENVS